MLTVARLDTTDRTRTTDDLRIRSLFDDPSLRSLLGTAAPAMPRHRTERPPANIRQLLERAAA